jgi:hypothetical protein
MATPGKLPLWRLQYEEFHAATVNTRERFMAWSKDLAELELQNQTVEFRRCLAEIKRNLQSYQETIEKPPTARLSQTRKSKTQTEMSLNWRSSRM